MMTSYKSKFNKLFYTVCTVVCPWCVVTVCVSHSGVYQLIIIRKTTNKDFQKSRNVAPIKQHSCE